MRTLPRFMLVALVIGCAACSRIPGTASNSVIIPNESIDISRSVSIPLESIAAGALIFVIVDPLAPNWHIEQTQLNDSRYLIALKKKRFTTGGDGEASAGFYRRAAQIARDFGDGSYRVLSYTEGIESGVPIAQRVAQGVVEIVPQRKPEQPQTQADPSPGAGTSPASGEPPVTLSPLVEAAPAPRSAIQP